MIKLLLLILGISSTSFAEDAKWSLKPSITLGAGFSATLIENDRPPVYGLIQVYYLNFGEKDGSLRFLGIGTSIGEKTEFTFSPGVGCIDDKYCIGPHFANKYIGLGFSFSFSGP